VTRLLIFALLLASCAPKFKPVEVATDEPRPAPVEPAKPWLPDESQFPNPQASARDSTYTQLDWRVLRGLNTRTGEIAPALRKFEGGAVRIAGFMVPFSDDYEQVEEFLLVPEAGMCVHTPPPPANQIVYVQMTGGITRVHWSKPVQVSGILEIVASDSPYGKVAFKVEAAEARADNGYR
jgi:hypothetical protein